MSKKTMKQFLEKTAATPALAERLEVLQKQYIEQIVALAKESGFELTPEDFVESANPLKDDQLEAISGGYNPHGPIFP